MRCINLHLLTYLVTYLPYLLISNVDPLTVDPFHIHDTLVHTLTTSLTVIS